MRVKCDYCDSFYDDSVFKCPYCGAQNKEEKTRIVIEEEPVKNDNKAASRKVVFSFIVAVISLAILLITTQGIDSYKKDEDIESAAVNYWERGAYKEAIDEIRKIETTSKKYDEAKHILSQMMADYEKIVKGKAISFFNSKEYASCLAVIHSASGYIPENKELTEYELEATNLYSNETMTLVKEKYISEGTTSAKAVLSEGLQVIPNNTKLLKLKELLDSVVIASGKSLRYMTSEGFVKQVESCENSYGETESGDLFTFTGNDFYSPWCEFLASKKWDVFSCNLDANISKEDHRIRLRVYVDGDIRYDSGVIDRSWKGDTIKLDITGANSVKIEVDNLVGLTESWRNPDPIFIVENPTFATVISATDFDKITIE